MSGLQRMHAQGHQDGNPHHGMSPGAGPQRPLSTPPHMTANSPSPGHNCKKRVTT